MNQRELRSLVAVPVAAVALFVGACGDDPSAPPGHPRPPVRPPPPASPDTTAPQTVMDLALAYNAAGDAVDFTWSAPRDDDAHARVDHYDVRYGYSLPFEWERAAALDSTPTPLDPGTSQELTLTSPKRASDLYASIRAIDGAGNESPGGAVAHVRVPGFSAVIQCVNVLSGDPIAGLDATITTILPQDVVTDADGRIALTDLAAGTVSIGLATGAAPVAYHSLHDRLHVESDTTFVVAMIPVQQPQSVLWPSILAMLKDSIFSPGGQHIIRRWRTLPVSFYARDFVNVNGIDYRALLQQAADRWNTRLGFQLFVPADADPSPGILVEFLPRSTMGSVNGVTNYTLDADEYPVHDRIRIVDDMVDGPRLYSIFMHELGHTIPLLHLPAGFIMYGGQPLPSDITDDEATMVQLLLALPNGTPLENYDSGLPAR